MVLRGARHMWRTKRTARTTIWYHTGMAVPVAWGSAPPTADAMAWDVTVWRSDQRDSARS